MAVVTDGADTDEREKCSSYIDAPQFTQPSDKNTLRKAARNWAVHLKIILKVAKRGPTGN